MSVKEVLDKTTQFFKNKNIESPRLEAELLLSSALNLKNRIDLYLKFDQPLNEAELQAARDLVRRKANGEPTAYILGEKAFFKHDFLVNKNVLIPRPETEILAEHAISWAKAKFFAEFNSPKDQPEPMEFRILDLGCGSGCLGISIAKEIENLVASKPDMAAKWKIELTLVDKSKEALEVSRKNCEKLQVASVTLVHGDVLDLDLPKEYFQIIVANPPYIANADGDIQENVKKFEPHMALFSGETGTECILSWSLKAKDWLSSSAYMGFEIGKDQGNILKQHFDKFDCFKQTSIIKDLAKLDRHVVGTR